jgi:SpoVK/Ycf46/Vps4 family AAA+-type ATPase
LKYLFDFLDNKNIEKSEVFEHLKCDMNEAKFLKIVTERYIKGEESVICSDILTELFGAKKYEHILHLDIPKKLIELGWLTNNDLFGAKKPAETSLLELLNGSFSLSVSFLRLLEEGSFEPTLPDIKVYNDHLEYLQEQFFRMELYQKISTIRQNYSDDSPTITRLRKRLVQLESTIHERVKLTKTTLELEHFFKEKHLNEKEQLIFLTLLKEEYSGGDENMRDMNTLIDIISVDDKEKISNRSLLEENARLIKNEIIDYDEIFTPFGGITRSFFINEDVLHNIINQQKKKKKIKIKLDTLMKEQEIFELIEPKTSLDEVVLHPKTRELLDGILHQVDKNVAHLLKEWGIKDRKSGIDARIILYGPPGTGKTMTAVSLAKSLKKQVLSFDCSKILSMYVGESEKNVRKIFDTYKDLCSKSKTEPVLLLNEADQFLSSRAQVSVSGAEKMHNQMQNIFLEQIEKFDGLLIATTNLLETIDPAFSRRFNYKVKFEKPDSTQRKELWQRNLPKNAPFATDIDIDKLASYPLTGGQVMLVVKNAAYTVAGRDKPLFTMKDFIDEIQKEISGNFDTDKTMGFLS